MKVSFTIELLYRGLSKTVCIVLEAIGQARHTDRYLVIETSIYMYIKPLYSLVRS